MDLDLYSGVSVTEAALNISRTSSLDGTYFDTANWEGKWCAVLSAGAATAGTTPTLNVKFQSCATSGGSYSDISGAAFTEVTDTASTQILGVDKKAHHRHVKVIGTIAGTNTPTFPFGVAVLSRAKNL